jgi:two-component system NtrC family sensor kinase
MSPADEQTTQWLDQLADERSPQALLELLREMRQKQLVQEEKLAAAGELIASVAHEINNPLTIMLGYVELTLQELGPDAWAVRSEVASIVEQIVRIQKVVNSLLRIAGPVRDMDVLDAAAMNGLIRETIAGVLHQSKDGAVEIALDLRSAQQVRIGRQDLQQIIANLVANASHAVDPSEGRIEIRSRDWPGRGLIITIADNGPGIDDDLASKIFEPFFTTKALGTGTGLGLSVSTALIRRYGGALTLAPRSSLRRGAEFQIWVLAEPVLNEQSSWLSQMLFSHSEPESAEAPDNDANAPAREVHHD